LGGDGSDLLIGDGGNDYIEGGAGFNTYVAGLGDDYIIDLSSDYSQIFYATSAITDHYSITIDFIDFATTGDHAFTVDSMPGGIVIFPSNVPHKQQVSKYKTSVEKGDRFGVDNLEGVENIVATKGRDIIYTATGINQTIYANDGDDDLYTQGSTKNQLFGGPGNDLFVSGPDAKDTFFGGEGDDVVRIWGDNNVDGDLFYGDDNRQVALPGIDTLDFSQSNYSWHIYLNPVSAGVLTGKAPLTALHDVDPRFTQPTLGVNGVVKKVPGVQLAGVVNPEVNFELRVADANTSNPGGRATSIGEFERIIGSQHRDLITGGSPDGAISIDGQGGDDVLFASQLFASLVEGGDGNDVLGTFNHTLGNETPKSLFNPALIAVLNGGKGDDTFVGGDFREQIDGGEGINLLTYEVSTSGVTVDLTTKTLDRGYATGDILVGGIVNVIGSQFDDIITGDELQNELVGWDGADVIRGMGGSDQLFGNDGDDQLFGGSGNDVLHGGNGADLLDGGEGNDTASWSLYQVHPKAGINRLTNDTTGVIADLKTGKAGLDTLVSIENLIGGVGNDQLFGDDNDNFLGGGAGNDLLDGRGGNDVLVGGRGDDILRGGDGDDYLSGGAGNNQLDGGAGTDSIDYSSLTYGVTVVMAGAGSRAALTSGEVTSLTPVDAYVWTDSLRSVPGPTGLPGDMIQTGTSETRFTYQIRDQGTDDPSDDVRIQEDPITPERIWKLNPLFAETPDDLKEVRFLPDEGLLPEQEVSVIQQYVSSRDQFTNIERIIGGKGNDNFAGNAEDTFFYGGAGADTIDGGAGIDTAGYQHSPTGVTVDLTKLVFKGGDAEGDSLKNIENIIGSAFADTLVGDNNNNRLTPGAGNDNVSGGGGTDTVVFEFASTGVYYQLLAGKLRVITADGPTVLSIDTISDDIEFLEFTDKTLSFADAVKFVVRGTESNNLLTGTIIADFIEGLGGDDIINGLDGDDILDGGSGNDLLNGGAGNDRLIGGTGLDQFVGGTGDDTYVVDNSNEIIIEALNEGNDTVETSVNFTLPAHVENALVIEGKSVSVTGNSLNNVLRGGIGNQTLLGLAGNDTLDGGEGADAMIGGAGDDIYFVDNFGDVVGPETADGGTDTIITRISMKVPENIENLVVDGNVSISLTGDYRNNRFFDGSNSILNATDALQGKGNSTFDGGAGQDSLTLSYSFADSTFALDVNGFLNISNGSQTDKARSIESFVFTDKTVTYDELFETLFPKEDVQLFAGNRFDTKHPIDMSPEGGGKQFLFMSQRSAGENDGNRYYFNTEFQTNGKGFFEGSGLLNPQTGTVSRLAVDFSGGNTTQMSVSGFSKPMLTMIAANWLFYQNAIFGGDDRITGSYHSDKLYGYRGDDIIFGGLGDKENYNVEGSAPSPRPSTIRDPGKTATNPAFFVFDGDDYIDGGEGNDILDGGTGADTLIGGPGDDILYGGGGNFADRLDGGEGNDTLTGGAGADVVVLSLGMGHDVMTDWEVGVDVLDTSSLGINGASLLTYAIAGLNTVISLPDGSTLTLQNVQLPGIASNVVDLSKNTFNGKTFDIGSLANHVALNGIGDINKDGRGDFAIGNLSIPISGSTNNSFTPNTTVYLGDPALPGSVSFKLLSKQNDRGLAISAAGDFNKDGIDDLIIGGESQSYILFGKTTAFDPIINLDNLDGKNGFQINVSGGYLETYVAGGFDFNGDGFDDVVIGAPQDNNLGGAAYVVFGSAGPFNAKLDIATLNGSNGMRINGFGSFTLTGESVSNAGDVNGDGVDDLIIGAPYLEVSDPAGIGSTDLIGGAFIVYGSKAPLPASLELMSMSATQGTKITGVYASGQDRTGGVVAGGGDVNGDGYDDVIIGVMQPTSPIIPDQPARAYLVYGSAGGLGDVLRLEDLNGTNGTAFKLDFPGPNHFALGAGSVAIVDDINNDRLADIVIGTRTRTVFSPEGNPTQVNNGKVFVVYGNKQSLGASVNLDNISSREGFIVVSPDGSGFGGEVASAGDINGDGGTDLLLGRTDAPSVVLFGSPRTDKPLSGTALVAGPAIVGKTLSIDTSALIDADGLSTIAYQWLRKGLPIAGASAATYVVKSDDAGSEISARLTITDGLGKVNTLTSNTSNAVQIDYATVAPVFDPNEILIGTNGKDVFTGGTGNDRIDGKAGIDVAKYQGLKSSFQITRNGTELTVKDLLGTEGTDTLVNVERLVFGDKALAFDIDGNAGLVAKLLITLLGRDIWQIPEYVSIGLDLLENAGFTYEQLMKMALNEVLGPNPSDETLVKLVYTNVVGVVPPQADLEFYLGQIANGTSTHVSLAIDTALHPLNQNYIQLIGLPDKGVEFVFG
ncbi:MAG: hypothetical protein Q8K97_16040, partial [Pseudohongiella sp.]|nr:hypothetical protein [Pseudohongiella sp.]